MPVLAEHSVANKKSTRSEPASTVEQIESTNTMSGDLYRLRQPTVGVYTDQDQQEIAIKLPQQAVVQVLKRDVDRYGLLEVMWERKVVKVFAMDLRSRGETVDTGSANITALPDRSKSTILITRGRLTGRG